MYPSHLVFVTGSRADFFLLLPVIKRFFLVRDIRVSVVVTGAHFAEVMGGSYKEVESAIPGDLILLKPSYQSDSLRDLANQTIEIMQKFLRYEETVDISAICLLGDRSETLAVALSAALLRIPVVHFHGGELTEGAIDNMFRHMISQASTLHLVSHPLHRSRLLDFGISSSSIKVVGPAVLGSLDESKGLDRRQLEKEINCDIEDQACVITIHPETLTNVDPSVQVKIYLEALAEFPNLQLFFTSPNSDPGGDVFKRDIARFLKDRKNALYFDTLGSRKYRALLREAKFCFGNSSSGVIEMPFLGGWTLNIGERQKGRQGFGNRIIHSKLESDQIARGIDTVLTNLSRHEDAGVTMSTDTSSCFLNTVTSEIIKFINELSSEQL